MSAAVIFLAIASFCISQLQLASRFDLRFREIIENRQYYRLVTSQLFVHGSVELLLTMLLIFTTERALQRKFGTSQLIQFYAFQIVFHIAVCLLALYLIEADLLLIPGPFSLAFGLMTLFQLEMPAAVKVDITPLALLRDTRFAQTSLVLTNKTALLYLAVQLAWTVTWRSSVLGAVLSVASGLAAAIAFRSRAALLSSITAHRS